MTKSTRCANSQTGLVVFELLQRHNKSCCISAFFFYLCSSFYGWDYSLEHPDEKLLDWISSEMIAPAKLWFIWQKPRKAVVFAASIKKSNWLKHKQLNLFWGKHHNFPFRGITAIAALLLLYTKSLALYHRMKFNLPFLPSQKESELSKFITFKTH